MAAVFVLPALAILLSPGVISTPAHEGPFAFTPDGKTMYLTRFTAGMTSPGFFVSHLKDGRWSEPAPAAFPEGAAAEPFAISPDGERLFFTHARDASHRSRLWIADRDGEGWKNARPVGGGLEKWDADQTSPSLAADGTLYFVSNRKPGPGGWDIYRSAFKNGQYAAPELIGEGQYNRISTLLHETSVAVAPDASFLIFSSTRASNGLGGSDLYLAEMRGSERGGVWAWNLGPRVNTSADEIDPKISPDGKRLYFCRSGDIYEVDLEAVRRAPPESAVWKRRTDMPAAREWPQLAAADGRIYVYGGLGGDRQRGWVHSVDVYDPASDSWSTLAAPPKDWKQGTLVSFENRLFLFRRGGPGVAEYRPQSKEWEIKPAKGAFAIGEAWPFRTRTVVLGRKAYTMYGSGELRESTWLAEYDFDTGVWTPKRAMPFPAPQLAAFNGLIYAFAGGQDPVHATIYDPAIDRWTEGAQMDMPRWESAVAVVGNEIWLVGGHGVRSDDPMDGDISPTVMCYNPRRNEWRVGPDLPYQRAAAAAVMVNGRLFVMGGLKPGSNFESDRSVLEFVPAK